MAEPCYLCRDDWQIGDEAMSLPCECPYWTHEACLEKAVSETCCCPMREHTSCLLDDEVVLASTARRGDLSKVQQLLDRGIQPSPQSILDSIPLLAAAEGGQTEIIRLLLEQGASVLEHNRYQRQHCTWASKGGHSKAAAELLVSGFSGEILLNGNLHVPYCFKLRKASLMTY